LSPPTNLFLAETLIQMVHWSNAYEASLQKDFSGEDVGLQIRMLWVW
jgi:hypothetical protein